jgi:hypothetical protein
LLDTILTAFQLTCDARDLVIAARLLQTAELCVTAAPKSVHLEEDLERLKRARERLRQLQRPSMQQPGAVHGIPEFPA